MAANDVREIERRKLNITEGLILAALLGMGGLIFQMNDSVTRLQVAADNTNRQLMALQTQLANVPALAERMSRVEVRLDTVEQNQKEMRGMRNLK